MKWTYQRQQWLRDLYPDSSNVFLAEFFGCSYSAIKNQAVKLGLKKSAAYMDGKPGSFKPGHDTWNKGKSHRPAGSEKGHFRPGGKPATTRPVGSERVDKDGILLRKYRDTGIKSLDWRPVHVVIWESHNLQTLPEGCIVRFVDGDKRNFDPANLECITRAENMRRNSVHRLPKEVAELVQLMGALNRQINKRTPA